MSILNKSEEEQLTLAKNSNDEITLSLLHKSISTSVRKEVAKNLNTPRKILNLLVYDSALNVSFTARQNVNCTIKREFKDTSHPCISCAHHINSSACYSCEKILNYNKNK